MLESIKIYPMQIKIKGFAILNDCLYDKSDFA